MAKAAAPCKRRQTEPWGLTIHALRHRAALAIRMVATHAGTIASSRRAGGAYGGDRHVAIMAAAASKLTRAYAIQVETMRRLKGGGSLRIEHVHLESVAPWSMMIRELYQLAHATMCDQSVWPADKKTNDSISAWLPHRTDGHRRLRRRRRRGKNRRRW